MSVQLVIAEKPSVARSIAAVIGAGERAAGTMKVKTMATADVMDVALDAAALAALCR